MEDSFKRTKMIFAVLVFCAVSLFVLIAVALTTPSHTKVKVRPPIEIVNQAHVDHAMNTQSEEAPL